MSATKPIVLASASQTRAALFSAAGIEAALHPARVDEEAIRHALAAEGANPRDIADTLAEMKARKISERRPDAVVIGCDQVLEFDGRALGKAESPDAGRAQLQALRGKTHMLHSAVVLYDQAQPVWRHIGEVRLTMRAFSDAWLDAYLARNWESARHCVGTYMIEGEGLRLFSRIEGDHFSILGIPMLPLVNYLADRGFIAA
ncbi:MAG: septum formation protein Maf [Cereibacter sphaeroides]|uniref:Nucleoside triphosphate pyrophosphatase n=1 Tax=Cereibacter sphaeroides TaxID=1063 RepID=A0A2W5S3X2_CERSP|nr:MAG: septum formation protein Maf [Cereibacter sphaeroides]